MTSGLLVVEGKPEISKRRKYFLMLNNFINRSNNRTASINTQIEGEVFDSVIEVFDPV